MKKVIIYIIVVLAFYNTVYSEDTTLVGKSAVIECFKAQKYKPEESWNITNPLDSKKDLACAWLTWQDAVYQAILDVKFTEIDLQIEGFLKSLQWKTNSVISIEDLSKKLSSNWDDWSFYSQYSKVCDTWIFQYMQALISDPANEMPTISTNFTTKDFVRSTNSPCKLLVKKKIKSYYDAWEVIIVREVIKDLEKSKKTYITSINKQYENLLLNFMYYNNALKVMDDKTPTYTPQAKD